MPGRAAGLRSHGVTQAALGVVQRSGGWLVYSRPCGLVHVVVPLGLRRAVQPALCLLVWSRLHSGARFSALVSPSGNGIT
jgi:hypothetical protein